MALRLRNGLAVIGLVLAIGGCAGSEPVRPGMEGVVWQVTGLEQPESVIYDRARRTIYVSNMAGPGNRADGRGFISRIQDDGRLLEREWISGLNAPKGMAIVDETMYVADINRLVEIDLERGIVRREWRAPAARLLNDVAAHNGEIYVSDMFGNAIYRLAGGRFERWLETPALESPNGLYATPERLIIGTWGIRTGSFTFETRESGGLKAVDYNGRSLVPVTGERFANVDGITGDGRGGFYVSDHPAGVIYRIIGENKPIKAFSPGPGAADLYHAEPLGLLLVPMLRGDALYAYRID